MLTLLEVCMVLKNKRVKQCYLDRVVSERGLTACAIKSPYKVYQLTAQILNAWQREKRLKENSQHCGPLDSQQYLSSFLKYVKNITGNGISFSRLGRN